MTTITKRARVDHDGNIIIAVGTEDIGREVVVTIEPASSARPELTREKWLEILNRTAGSIDDPTFQRPPQHTVPAPPSFE